MELNSKNGKKYLGAMNAAANFAFANRYLMGKLVQRTFNNCYPDSHLRLLYDVPHNIAKFETHSGEKILVHRKGATRAFGPKRMIGTSFGDTGQPVLIPGSMGTASYILSGMDDNDHHLASVNHGAGRAMSRTKARGKWKGNKMLRPPAISEKEFKDSMKGVMMICENLRHIKEEAPQAYKDIDLVMETVIAAGLANAVVRLKPLAVLKG